MAHYAFIPGTAKWAKLDRPDTKFGTQYTIDLYLDKEGLKAYKESGLAVELRKDEEGTFIKLRRDVGKLFDGMPEKPKKLRWDEKTKQYVDFDQLIGNGSKVIAKVQVYETKRGLTGHRLEAVAVHELVEYKAPDEAEDQDDFPF